MNGSGYLGRGAEEEKEQESLRRLPADQEPLGAPFQDPEVMAWADMKTGCLTNWATPHVSLKNNLFQVFTSVWARIVSEERSSQAW